MDSRSQSCVSLHICRTRKHVKTKRTILPFFCVTHTNPWMQWDAGLKSSRSRKIYARVWATTEREGNIGISCIENNICCYNTNEHQHRQNGDRKLHFLFFRLTSCWDSEALILLVMLGSKQLQWINKITHLDMPVNLIILEQGEGLGNRTKAIRLTEAEAQAAMVAEHNSSLKQIFLRRDLFFFSWETLMFYT